MAEETALTLERGRSFRFTRRPMAIAAELRPDWKMAALLLINLSELAEIRSSRLKSYLYKGCSFCGQVFTSHSCPSLSPLGSALRLNSHLLVSKVSEFRARYGLV